MNDKRKIVVKGSDVEQVRKIALKLLRRLPSTIEYNDLYSAGLQALVEGVQRIGRYRGTSRETYLKHRVFAAMLDLLTKIDRERRRQLLDGEESELSGNARNLTFVSLALATDEADPALDPGDELDRRRYLRRISDSLKALPDDLYEVYVLHFEEGVSYADMSDRLGISKKFLRRLGGRAIKRLRQLVNPPPQRKLKR